MMTSHFILKIILPLSSIFTQCFIFKFFLSTSTLCGLYVGTQSGQNRPDYFVDIFLTKTFLSKIFEGEMFIRMLPTTLLQIFCENLLYFQVIFKSMKLADDTFSSNSKCEWVNITESLMNALGFRF